MAGTTKSRCSCMQQMLQPSKLYEVKTKDSSKEVNKRKAYNNWEIWDHTEQLGIWEIRNMGIN